MDSNQNPDPGAGATSFADLQKQYIERFQGYALSPSSVAIQPAVRCQLGGCGCEWNTFIWVSQPLECIWFEIPKNASSSFKAAIALGQQNPLAFQMHQGSPDSAIKRFPNFKRFAIIREPFDRIRSIHRMFCLSDLEFRHRQLQALFEVSDVRLTLSRFLTQARQVRNHHWEQMIRFLPTQETESVALIRMEEDFPKTLARFFQEQCRVALDLPCLNSTGRPSNETLSPDETAQIESMFGEDLALYRKTH